MIDNIGGPSREITLCDKNLKKMGDRAGAVVTKVFEESTRLAADEAFQHGME